jgi:uncharacterized phage protein (TIGR02216 family)
MPLSSGAVEPSASAPSRPFPAAPSRPFPWRELMRLFLGERRMAPAEFWALTLPEIEAVVGRSGGEATRRAELARLMEAFPDGG